MLMSRWLFVVVAWAASPFGLPAESPIADPDAYAVYEQVLPHEWPDSVEKATLTVVQRETVTQPDCFASGKVLDTEEWKPVVDSFHRENATRRVLQPGFLPDPPYMLVPAAVIKSALAGPNGDWRPFYQLYPNSGGYIELSAVGFDDTKTRAIVYVAHHCGGLCGGGTHHFLAKRNGTWQPARLEGLQVCRWVS